MTDVFATCIAVGRSKNLYGGEMAKQRRTANEGDHVAQVIAARASFLDLGPNIFCALRSARCSFARRSPARQAVEHRQGPAPARSPGVATHLGGHLWSRCPDR